MALVALLRVGWCLAAHGLVSFLLLLLPPPSPEELTVECLTMEHLQSKFLGMAI